MTCKPVYHPSNLPLQGDERLHSRLTPLAGKLPAAHARTVGLLAGQGINSFPGPSKQGACVEHTDKGTVSQTQDSWGLIGLPLHMMPGQCSMPSIKRTHQTKGVKYTNP
jgi:hypothetical protein